MMSRWDSSLLPHGSGKASCAVSHLIMAQLLICLFLFTGCAWNADPHVMSDYPPSGVIEMSCPKCAECEPIFRGKFIIRVDCAEPIYGCCNEIHANYACGTGKFFRVKHNECDQIKWVK